MYLDGDLLVLGELINIWIWVEPGASGSKGQVPRCSIDTVVFTTDPAQNFVIGSRVFLGTWAARCRPYGGCHKLLS
jgi:hypothetical protein